MSPIITGQRTESGRQYWRSLEQLHQSPSFDRWVEREFPLNATQLDEPSRRTLLKLMAASFGLAGAVACRRPVENILPFSRGVEDLIPGKSVYYASGFSLDGVTDGVLIETHDGRPTKVEGNREHPTGTGAATVFEQASVLQVYDPDRAKSVLRNRAPSTWEEFETFVTAHLEQAGDGSGIRFLSDPISSPSLNLVRSHVLERFPGARWTEYAPLADDQVSAAARLVFNREVQPVYDLSAADRVLSLDADFLGLDWLGKTATRDFGRRRRPATGTDTINRLYVAESRFSVTGAMADHRLRVTPAEIEGIAVALAGEFGLFTPEARSAVLEDPYRRRWLSATARDLASHRGRSLILAGPRQPAEVQALAYWLNEFLGNVGETVSFAEVSPLVDSPQDLSLTDLASEMAAGGVTTLVMVNGNPAFDTPADLGFSDLLADIPTTIRFGIEEDETAALSEWVLPASHYLEAWGDGRATNGTATLQQPMIQPLYDTRSTAEFVALVGNYPESGGYDIVRNYWLEEWGASGDERRWRRALHDGAIPETAYPEFDATIDVTAIREALEQRQSSGAVDGIEVSFYPDAAMYDGRFANNGWLQETPDPMSKLTWDNAALLSPVTAKTLAVENNDVIQIEVGGRSVEIPVLIQPGHADKAISLSLGYGRTSVGSVGRHVGQDVYPLRTTEAFWHSSGATVRKTTKRHPLACTQDHHSMEGRPIARELSVGESLSASHESEVHHAPLYQRTNSDDGYQWGMSIDLSSCIGCNACMVACQAENNIPIVGKAEVANGREMHWIRLDRYYVGDENEPQAVTQPVACQHCENAPCETVCPVAATVHSDEGLNDMVYNRCVGTRYCANNCPYKVRRFNYLDYHGDLAETEKMAFNPNVTVRMRGVMEKCTYCVQRIQEAKITASSESRDVQDGEIQSACQQTCPTEAIVFGNITDPNSEVARLRSEPRNYSVLEELNTKPRTTYLAKVRNPNPELSVDG